MLDLVSGPDILVHQCISDAVTEFTAGCVSTTTLLLLKQHIESTGDVERWDYRMSWTKIFRARVFHLAFV